jgi:hypothetical protein
VINTGECLLGGCFTRAVSYLQRFNVLDIDLTGSSAVALLNQKSDESISGSIGG